MKTKPCLKLIGNISLYIKFYQSVKSSTLYRRIKYIGKYQTIVKRDERVQLVFNEFVNQSVIVQFRYFFFIRSEIFLISLFSEVSHFPSIYSSFVLVDLEIVLPEKTIVFSFNSKNDIFLISLILFVQKIF